VSRGLFAVVNGQSVLLILTHAPLARAAEEGHSRLGIWALATSPDQAVTGAHGQQPAACSYRYSAEERACPDRTAGEALRQRSLKRKSGATSSAAHYTKAVDMDIFRGCVTSRDSQDECVCPTKELRSVNWTEFVGGCRAISWIAQYIYNGLRAAAPPLVEGHHRHHRSCSYSVHSSNFVVVGPL
jgi:hypothetical protein